MESMPNEANDNTTVTITRHSFVNLEDFLQVGIPTTSISVQINGNNFNLRETKDNPNQRVQVIFNGNTQNLPFDNGMVTIRATNSFVTLKSQFF